MEICLPLRTGESELAIILKVILSDGLILKILISCLKQKRKRKHLSLDKCPSCGEENFLIWEYFNTKIKKYKFANKKIVEGKPFYYCKVCGRFFLLAGKKVFTWINKEWVEFKPMRDKFVFR